MSVIKKTDDKYVWITFKIKKFIKPVMSGIYDVSSNSGN